ncbi:MAG: hypothetical protein ACQER1_18285 [Armatimonadota bacterium]
MRVAVALLAALILLCMSATYAIERDLEQMGERHRQLAVQGEVESYGLDTGMTGRPQSGVQETGEAEGV